MAAVLTDHAWTNKELIVNIVAPWPDNA